MNPESRDTFRDLGVHHQGFFLHFWLFLILRCPNAKSFWLILYPRSLISPYSAKNPKKGKPGSLYHRLPGTAHILFYFLLLFNKNSGITILESLSSTVAAWESVSYVPAVSSVSTLPLWIGCPEKAGPEVVCGVKGLRCVFLPSVFLIPVAMIVALI